MAGTKEKTEEIKVNTNTSGWTFFLWIFVVIWLIIIFSYTKAGYEGDERALTLNIFIFYIYSPISILFGLFSLFKAFNLKNGVRNLNFKVLSIIIFLSPLIAIIINYVFRFWFPQQDMPIGSGGF